MSDQRANCTVQHQKCSDVQLLFHQGGSTYICCVLRSSSAVKILTKFFLSLHCIDLMIANLFAKIFCFDLDREHHRNGYSGLTVDHKEYLKLTFNLTADEDRSTQHMQEPPSLAGPCRPDRFFLFTLVRLQ